MTGVTAEPLAQEDESPPPATAADVQNIVGDAVQDLERHVLLRDPDGALGPLRLYLANGLVFPQTHDELTSIFEALTTLSENDREFLIDNLPPGTYYSAAEVTHAIYLNSGGD
jgi:hypothetical protein